MKGVNEGVEGRRDGGCVCVCACKDDEELRGVGRGGDKGKGEGDEILVVWSDQWELGWGSWGVRHGDRSGMSSVSAQ